MNKSALKKFATEARIELLEKVELQAMKLGITAQGIEQATVESSDAVFIDDRQLTDAERKQRNKLITRINEIGFDRVMDETAYTWFNRFIALRYMEVNDYLPTKVRVLSSSSGSLEPDMMKEALSLDLDLDKELIYELKMDNKTDELFKYLIKVHCNDLNRYMPFMFETIEDYTEILFPEGLLGTDSFLRKMTETEVIEEDNWQEIEVIGWLYQYYIADEKDEVFANLKKRIKISKEKVPAATQLFTPHWIVRYMVENSLGRIWLESIPDTNLKSNWTYFLDEAEQDEEVMQQLKEIRYKDVDIEEITFIDPSCGSGHILVYAFDLFYDMYLERGYMEREIPKLILEKNLFGLDVDDRAAQLASFALMMKAREKSRRVFRQEIKPSISSIHESNWLSEEIISSIAGENEKLSEMLQTIRKTFVDAKEYGSLLTVSEFNFDLLEERVKEYLNEESDLLGLIDKQIVGERLPQLITQARMLSWKYDVVCTNPPYMGRRGMSPKLTKYLDANYKDTKSDLFAAFIEKGFDLTNGKGFNSMVTMQSWMFLSSFEKMRMKILEEKTISTLLHMDNNVMGIAFGTSATVFRNVFNERFKGNYTEVKHENINAENNPKRFPVKSNRTGLKAAVDFKGIPGNPIAYWISENMKDVFENPLLFDYSISDGQNKTGNNNKFVRFFWEVEDYKIGIGRKWFFYAKGGGYRKWIGNLDSVVDWSEKTREHYRKDHVCRIIPEYLWYEKGITWGLITSNVPSFRVLPEDATFDVGGSSIFLKEYSHFQYFIALLNSKLFVEIAKIFNPTLNFQVKDIRSMPIILPDINTKSNIDSIVSEIESLSEEDWNAFEISSGFKSHPLLKRNNISIADVFEEWSEVTVKNYYLLKNHEEELNQIFINIYGLQDELTPEVENKDVSVRKAKLERDIKSFLSYFIGCTFGRYSLDEEGLIFAGGEFDASRYETFAVDENNIIPILDGAYFEDDIVTRFVEFMKVTFSEETIEENLDFIADALKCRKNETARETIRRYFMNDFYKDHVRTYKKRPIYWQFTSGKEKAFNCLIYMHRYDKSTLSRIRTDYLHEVQNRLDAEKKDLQDFIEGDHTTKEINTAKKSLVSLDKKIAELKAYDEVLHHMADMQIEIDLDDGVVVNYGKFEGVVGKI